VQARGETYAADGRRDERLHAHVPLGPTDTRIGEGLGAARSANPPCYVPPLPSRRRTRVLMCLCRLGGHCLGKAACQPGDAYFGWCYRREVAGADR
jgi:hypothetical protein